ncbi:T9SS type A sorting domain-containing protein [Adhaeribacter pallidiroseus]|uniref:Secretion system C-terminal sorting domain-containing protein n=1 Tax=Adhaeribacter pallidiroseus TaxID=2072847 RepID=A0A369QG33_9BACT|nr:T9SS type A sorting domain-containing protein [Adhaeribacter pallidiroseus]RDC63664.1 hypothetical protein AHMF7616_02269 [Adhaeribacter pallidiroseus]
MKAVQEQQQTINVLSAEVNKLKTENRTGSNLDLNSLPWQAASLEQNQPNPVNHTTTFRYSIPAGSTVQILVFDSNTGKNVKTLSASTSGQVEMNRSDLKAGTYIYSLVVNGKSTASKHLTINK